MKICYFGAYEDSYPRNKVIRQGLKQNGVVVYECHDNTSPTWRRYPKLLGKFLALPKDFQAMIVAEFGQNNVLLAKILSVFSGKILIFDAFVLFYEAYVVDRGWYKKGSLMARWLHFVDKQAVKLADYILCQTEEQADDYSREFGIQKQKIKILYLGSSDELFYPQETARQADDFKVLFYGTYTAQTGLEYVLKAAGKLKKQKDIKFYFIGDHPPHVRKLCDELDLTNATFEGRISPEEVPRRIAASDIILGIFGDTPKGNNVVSNRVIQAMAMKKPLITGKTHAINRMLKDKIEAVLCPLCDAKSIAESILLLYRDKDLRNKLAENGYEFYRNNFTPEVIGKKLKRILEDIVHTETSSGKIKPAGGC
ncbi:MAG: glycosyltransferase family 4 protein [Lentisphaerae bacterium]|nr:glycosyltransferase family 4 protein [Lentisphaerota bacterium]